MIPRVQGQTVPKGEKIALKIEARVGIQAPSALIWEVIGDLSTWPEWSGIYPKAEGTLRIGARLDMTLALPGLSPREFEPVIIDWVPEEQILWRDNRWGGWVISTRFIEIEELGPASCFLSNGEQFPGAVAEYYMKRNRRALKAGYQQFADAAKERAEMLWNARQADAK